jgi:four helix bundle suffix protein
LRDFHVATLIYDATVLFCERFVDRRSRTVDQMVQAARSGRQNIAEGSRASAASSQVELRLVNTARASLEELLLDYEDYLRQHQHRAWAKDDPEAQAVRRVGRERHPELGSNPKNTGEPDAGDRAHWNLYASWLEHKDPAIVANTLICLIHQANYLLDQQIHALEREFVQEGGYSEQLARARIAERARAQRELPQQPPLQAHVPACPVCGGLMVLRTARQGRNAGSNFWGCAGYPNCKGSRPLDAGAT